MLSHGGATPGLILAEIPLPWQSKAVIIKLYIMIFWLPLLMRLMTCLCPAMRSGRVPPLRGGSRHSDKGGKFNMFPSISRLFLHWRGGSIAKLYGIPDRIPPLDLPKMLYHNSCYNTTSCNKSLVWLPKTTTETKWVGETFYFICVTIKN